MKKRIINQSKLIKSVLISFVIISAFCTGCGVPKTKGNTKAAMELIQNLDYEGAFAALEEAEAQGENGALILRAKGIANLGLANYEEAAANFLEALTYSDWQVDNLDYDINFYLADTYERMGDYQSASDTYSAILGLREKDMLARYRRGSAYLKLNRHDEAIVDFERALALAPDNYDLRIEVAGRLSENGYEEEGRKYLEDFLAEKEKKLSAFDKGRIYFYMEDYVSAKTNFEAARDDDDQNTILFLGKTYEMLGDFNYATSTYQNYLTQHPEAAVIYNQLGLTKINSGDYAGAKEAFTTAKNLENTGIEKTLSFNEIAACEYLGDFNQAKVLMEAYLKKYPDDAAALRENIFLSTR